MATNIISCVVGKADYAEGSDAVLLPLHKLTVSLTRNTDGTFNYQEVTYLTNVYRRTFLYDAAKRPISLSLWVKQ